MIWNEHFITEDGGNYPVHTWSITVWAAYSFCSQCILAGGRKANERKGVEELEKALLHLLYQWGDLWVVKGNKTKNYPTHRMAM